MQDAITAIERRAVAEAPIAKAAELVGLSLLIGPSPIFRRCISNLTFPRNGAGTEYAYHGLAAPTIRRTADSSENNEMAIKSAYGDLPGGSFVVILGGQ